MQAFFFAISGAYTPKQSSQVSGRVHEDSNSQANFMKPIKQIELSNGWPLFYRSQLNLKVLVREFLEDDIYGRNGVSVKDGDVILDVGANIGVFATWIGTKLNHGSIHCFEPIPETFEVLKKNTELQSHLKIGLHQVGISREPGKVEFKYNPNLAVGASMKGPMPEDRKNSHNFIVEELNLRNRLLGSVIRYSPRLCWWPLLECIRLSYRATKKVECRVTTISRFLDDNNISSVDLLKIDVEGAEEDVLEGIDNSHWPKIRQVVLESHFGIGQAERIQQQLMELGFQSTLEQVAQGIDHLHLVTGIRVD